MQSSEPNPAARDSAPYGTACAGCSRAKCRCIPRGNGLSCERCHRLRRDCIPSNVVRKRVSRRGAGQRTSQLEEKLEDIVALLRSQAREQSGSSEERDHNSQTSQGGGDWGNSAAYPRGQGQQDAQLPNQNSHAQQQTSAEASRRPQDASMYYLTPQMGGSPYPVEASSSQADECLKVFREYHMRAFPFIYIHPDTTVAELASERPFLWLSIRATTSKNTSEQVALEVKVRQILAQRLLVDLERSLDLLLGLLVYLTWCVEKYRGKALLSAFAGLATSLVADLRLDKQIQEYPCREINVCSAYTHPIKQQLPTTNRTNEERRAVLGCYAVSATICPFLKASTMRWMPHMEDCLQHLYHNPEVEGDEILVVIIRAFQVFEDVNAISLGRNLDYGLAAAPQTPSILHVKQLRGNLDAIKKMVRPELLSNRIVVSILSSTEALVNELPLFVPDQPTVLPGFIDYGRMDCFYACLRAIKECLDNFLSFSSIELFSTPMMIHLHFVRCTHIIYRLSLMENAPWDRAAILGTIDLIAMLEQTAKQYELVKGDLGLETDGMDTYTRVVDVLRGTIPVWRKAFEDAGAIPPGVGNTSTPLAEQDFGQMDPASDSWFANFFTFGETY